MITHREIEQGILKAINEIDEMVEDIAEATYQQATTEVAYKLSFAKARTEYRLLNEKATVGAVEDYANDTAKKELLAYRIAEARLMACRETLRATQAKLDGFRSLMASHRSAGG